MTQIASPLASSSPEPAAPPAVRIEQLSHRYNAAGIALDRITLTIPRGVIFGILGPNGGGKTTLFRILISLLQPSEYHALEILGYSIPDTPALVRRQIGVTFQSPSLDTQLTAVENLWHQGRLYGLGGRPLQTRIDELMDYFQLRHRGGERVEKLSGGMRRRVEIAKALLHKPQVLLLDEPSTGLDPAVRLDVWRLLDRLRREQNMTVVMTTHFMEEAERCDQLAILHGGRLVAQGSPDDLKCSIGGDVVKFKPAAEEQGEELRKTIHERWKPWASGTSPRLVDGWVRLERNNGPAFATDVATALAGSFSALQVGKPTLDDVFLRLTGRLLSEPPQENDPSRT